MLDRSVVVLPLLMLLAPAVAACDVRMVRVAIALVYDRARFFGWRSGVVRSLLRSSLPLRLLLCCLSLPGMHGHPRVGVSITCLPRHTRAPDYRACDLAVRLLRSGPATVTKLAPAGFTHSVYTLFGRFAPTAVEGPLPLRSAGLRPPGVRGEGRGRRGLTTTSPSLSLQGVPPEVAHYRTLYISFFVLSDASIASIVTENLSPVASQSCTHTHTYLPAAVDAAVPAGRRV